MNKRSDDGDEDLPALGQNATQGQLGEALVEAAILQLNQLYERRSGLDFGVDGVIEITTTGTAPRATGRQIGVQVKRGLSIVKKTRYGFTHYCTDAHANYWLKHSLPIIVVHSDPVTGRLRWQHVSEDTLRKTDHGYAIDLPSESELRTSLDALRALADNRPFAIVSSGRTFVVPYSMQHGIRTGDSDLGLAALDFSRAALRGEHCHLVVETEEEPDILAKIDAVRDIETPTYQERRDAILHEDILHRIRKHVDMLRRALSQLLTQQALAEAFGYHDDLLAEAIHRLMAPQPRSRELGSIALDAWPTYGVVQPKVRFYVPEKALDAYYAKDSFNEAGMQMGDAGGCIVGELHPDIFAARFLPMLALQLIEFAECQGLPDSQVLNHIGVQPSMWLMGIA